MCVLNPIALVDMVGHGRWLGQVGGEIPNWFVMFPLCLRKYRNLT